MNPIYCKYSNDRDKQFRIKTCIKLDEAGNKVIYKYPASDFSKAHIHKMYENYQNMCKSFEGSNFVPNKCELEGDAVKFEFLSQMTMEGYLDNLYAKGQYFEIIEAIKKYRDELYGLKSNIDFKYTEEFEQVFGKNTSFMSEKSLEISNIDMVFGNILLGEKNTVIDYEWILDFPVPIEFILFRTIYYYVHGNAKRSKLIEYNIFELLGISEQKKAMYFEMENMFQKYVAGESATLSSLKETMLKRRKNALKDKSISGMNYVQVYFDYGQGYSEEDSFKKYYNYIDNKVSIKIKTYREIKSLRIDPAGSSVIISNFAVFADNTKLSVSSTNAHYMRENVMAFGNDEPQVIISKVNRCSEIRVEFDLLSPNENTNHVLVDTIIDDANRNSGIITQQRTEIDNLNAVNSNIQNEKNILDVRCREYEIYINNLRSKFIWKIASAMKKTLRSLKNEGIIVTLKKIARKVKNKLFKKKSVDTGNSVVQAVNKNKTASAGKKYILVVVHEAQKAGGSWLSLSIIKTIKKVSDFEPVVLMISGGPLTEEFRKAAITYELGWPDFSRVYDANQLNSVVAQLKQLNISYALCNCVVTGIVAEHLKANNIKIATMVHELPTSIKGYNFEQAAQNAAKYSDDMVFAANFVKEKFVENYPFDEAHCHIIPQGVYSIFKCGRFEDKLQHKKKICEKLNVSQNAKFVLGCGYGNFRKGLDWFGLIAVNAMKKNKDLHFIWIGEKDPEFEKWINNDLQAEGLQDRFHWMGYVNNTEDFFIGSDVFLLSSREDPFPSVVLDSMKGYTPVIAFENAGGIPEILANECGISVPYGDCNGVVDAIEGLLSDSEKYERIAKNAKHKLEDMSPQNYVKKLLSILMGNSNFEKVMPDLKVSVVIPNYNYERYIPERLDSILNQTIQPYEIIFLDDVSKDNSVQVARDILEQSGIKYQIIANKENQGCFKQWLNGKNAASGDLIWIAEADDVCELDFIERLLPYFNDDQVNLAYGQSEVIYEEGEHSGFIYTEYTKDLSEEKWAHDYVTNGETEIIDGLGIKNTIPNASGVIMRKSAMEGLDDVLCNFTISGDWLGYVYTIKTGKIAFCSDVLNYHRRHRNSIIHQKEQDIRMFLELMDIKLFIADNFMIPASIKDRFLNHIKNEYNRLVTDKSKAFENQEQLMEKYNLLQKKVEEKIETYPYLKNSPQKKILFVMPDFEMGGGQTLVVRLANYFSKFHKVFVYNARPWLYEERIAKMFDTKVEILDSTGNPDELRAYVINNQIEIINDHIWWSDKIVYKAVHDLDTRVVLSMHGCYEALLEHPDWDVEFEQLVDKILGRANEIIYATEKNTPVFKRVSVDEKIHQIYYGYELESIPRVDREALGIEKDSFVFGMVARGIKEKGFGEAVEAFIKMKEKYQHKADLVLIGNGTFIDELKNKYADVKNVHFMDNLKKPSEWIGYVKMFDCAMLPTYFISESLPNSVIEYLAYGKPVISTDIGDIKYMLLKDEHKAGIVLDLKNSKVDADELADAMYSMVSDKELYNQCLAGSKEMFKQFDIKNFANNYYELFVG